MTTNKKNMDYDMMDTLILWIDNTRFLYESVKYICKNLARKRVRGTYKKELAPKAFYGVVCNAMKDYCKHEKFQCSWYRLLTVEERKVLCERLVNENKYIVTDYVHDLLLRRK